MVTSRSPAVGPAAGPDHTPAGPAQADGPPAGPTQTGSPPAGPTQTGSPPAGPTQTGSPPAGPAQTDGPPARYAALPLTEDGRPPPGPHVKVAAPPGEHPLLQFSHPALALTGLGFWLAFVLVRYRPLAWVSFGILLVTLGAGLGWLASNALAARRRQGAARTFPPRLIALHGLARSEEHTSELQSLRHLVCRLLLEKKK